MKTLVIIPSRMSATRLPGKPLLKINGKSIISLVFKRAESAGIGEVVVATEDNEIVNDVKKKIEEEGVKLINSTQKNGKLILLDEQGENLTSAELAGIISKWKINSYNRFYESLF